MDKEYICIECGKLFQGSIKAQHKFCSNKCGFRYRRKTGITMRGKQIKTNCELCGKIFFNNRTQKGKFCSRLCADKGEHRNNPKTGCSTIEIICRECKKPFYDSLYNLRKYCSKECYWKFRLRQCGYKSFNCLCCKKDFVIRVSRYRSGIKSYNRKFCSKTCCRKMGANYGYRKNKN